MSGLYLLLLALIWLAFILSLTYKVVSRVKNTILRAVLALLLMGVLLPLPLVDEFVGERQFEQLCRDNATIQVDRATAAGKTVYFVSQPASEVEGPWVRVVLMAQRYVDSVTGDAVVSFNTLTAEGGVLVRTFGLSEGRAPLTFTGTCGPRENPRDLFNALGITAKDRQR